MRRSGAGCAGSRQAYRSGCSADGGSVSNTSLPEPPRWPLVMASSTVVARLIVGMRLTERLGASRERLGVRWEAFSATPLSQAGTILRTTNDAHRQITRGSFPTGRSQSGVADASASPSHLCHRTPRRCRDSRSVLSFTRRVAGAFVFWLRLYDQGFGRRKPAAIARAICFLRTVDATAPILSNICALAMR